LVAKTAVTFHRQGYAVKHDGQVKLYLKSRRSEEIFVMKNFSNETVVGTDKVDHLSRHRSSNKNVTRFYKWFKKGAPKY